MNNWKHQRAHIIAYLGIFYSQILSTVVFSTSICHNMYFLIIISYGSSRVDSLIIWREIFVMTINETNMASPWIEEESLESVFSKIFEESNLRERMNLANSSSIEIPKLVNCGHPPMETDNVGNLLDGIFSTRIENSDGVCRRTARS